MEWRKHIEHVLVGGGFLVERQGVGAGGGGHTPETDGGAVEEGVDISACFGRGSVQYVRQCVCSLAAGTAEVMAPGNLLQQRGDVRPLHNLQVLIGSVALQASDRLRRVEDGNTLLPAKSHDGFAVKHRLAVLLVVPKTFCLFVPPNVFCLCIVRSVCCLFAVRSASCRRRTPAP